MANRSEASGRERFSPVASFVPPARIMPTRRFIPSELDSACSRLDVDSALRWLARISRRISMPLFGGRLEIQRTCVEWTMGPTEIQRLQAYAAENDHAPIVYFRGQLLELLRWLAYSSSTRKIANYSKMQLFHERGRFLFATLCAGQIWSKRAFHEVSTDSGDALTSRRQEYLLSFRRSREAATIVGNTYQPLARSYIIFGDVLPTLLGQFLTKFREVTGLAYEDFLNCQALFWASLINNKNEWAHIDLLELPSHRYRHILQRFLRCYAQPLSALATADGTGPASERSRQSNRLRKLRRRPILLTSNGNQAVVPDTVIFSEFLSVGPLFEVLPFLNEGMLFDRFGRACEEYCARILQRAYPTTSHRLARRLYQNVTGGSGADEFEVDAHVVSGSAAAVLEVKASFVSEDVTTGTNAQFVDHLRDRYVSDDAGRPKGVKQLARVVNAICSNDWSGEEDEFNAVVRLFPVLVVLDSQLDSGLFGRFLAEEFAAQFGKHLNDRDGGFNLRGRWVAHLLVLTVEALENLEDSLHQFSLLDMMKDYSEAHPDRLLSVHNYLLTSDYSGQLRHNRHMVATADEIFRRAKFSVFGK